MRGGWVYMLANRYRGSLYVGVSAALPERIHAHRQGRGSIYAAKRELDLLVWAEFFPTIEEAIAFEKRLKRWRREWKFELVERGNPEWEDLFPMLIG
jgi:putative endonuclease